MAVKSARGAPLPEGSALVAEPQVQELVQRSLTLMEKIMQDIEVTHKSCVTVKVCKDRADCPAGWLVCPAAPRVSFPAAEQRAGPVSKKALGDPAS